MHEIDVKILYLYQHANKPLAKKKTGMRQDAGIHLPRRRSTRERCWLPHNIQDAGKEQKGKEQNHPGLPTQMQVQRNKPDTDSSLDAGSPNVIPIVVAMLWSNHCDYQLQKSEKEKKNRKNSEYIQQHFGSKLRMDAAVALQKRNYIYQPIRNDLSETLTP